MGKRYMYKSAYEVRSRYKGPVQYWLVHASKHEDAAWLMNDCIVKVDRMLLAKTYEVPDQLPGLVEGTVSAHDAGVERELRAAMVETLVRLGGQATFGRLRHELFYGGFYGRVTQAAHARVLKALVKEKAVRRQQQSWWAKLDVKEVVSMPACRPSESCRMEAQAPKL